MMAGSAGFISAVPVPALGLVALGVAAYREAGLVHADGVRYLPGWLRQSFASCRSPSAASCT